MEWGIVMTAGTLVGMIALTIMAATIEAPVASIQQVEPEPVELKQAA